MKYLASIILLITFLSLGIQAQSRLELKNKPIENDLLIKILNLSEMKELKPPTPTEQNFFLRLYSLDDMSNDEDSSLEYCAPGVETEVTCGFRYFLAVHDGSLGVPGAVYDLGQVGEITKIKWLKKSNSDFDRLRLEVTNYPAHAFKINPKLVKKTKVFELYVNLNSLKIESKPLIKFESEEEDCENFANDSGFWIEQTGIVKQINDDNSLLVKIRDENKIIKLVAVSSKFNNKEIKAFLSDKLLNKNINLTIYPGDGSKKTYFATVSESSIDISRYLLENGLAKYENVGGDSVSNYEICIYKQLEKKAKEAKLGIWAK